MNEKNPNEVPPDEKPSNEKPSDEKPMTHKPLDTVVLARDLPDFGLRAGDVGAVVFVLPPDAVEVEFVSGSGDTIAVVTLRCDEVRAVANEEVLAVREIRRSA